MIIGAVSQVFGHGRAVDNLTGVHDALGVEGPFQLLECLVNLRSEHLLGVNSPDYPIAVLSAQGAAVLLHQIADLIGNGHHRCHALGAFQANEGTDVQAAHAGVAIISGFGAVVAHNLVEPFHEGAKSLRVDSRVFNEGEGLGVAMNAHQQSQAALSQVPDPVLSGAVQDIHAGVGQTLALDVPFQGVGFRD